MGTLSIRLTTSLTTRKKRWRKVFNINKLLAPQVQKRFSTELRNSFKEMEKMEKIRTLLYIKKQQRLSSALERKEINNG